MKDFGKVAVLLGGKSAEREVSLNSGNAVLAALKRSGVDAYAFDTAQQPLHDLESYNRVFIALHGRYGEDGTVQGALELMSIPYTGSGVLASSLGMDKWRTKLMWQATGIPTPAFEIVHADSDFAAIEKRLGLPLFVKPANEGSSVGISKVKQTGGLEAAYMEAAKYDALVIAEQFVGGGEYTVGILGDTALPIIRIIPANDFTITKPSICATTRNIYVLAAGRRTGAAYPATSVASFSGIGWTRLGPGGFSYG